MQRGGGVGRVALAILCSSLLVPSLLVFAPAAHAEQPAVGECFDLGDDRVQAGTADGARALGADGYWDGAGAVPCDAPHTFEVTEVGLIPADANAFDFAAGRCGALSVWTAVGVNTPRAGVVANPLRIAPRSFAVRQPQPLYVCGAVALSFDGRRPPTAVRLTAPIEELTRTERAALRYCSSAAKGRRAQAPAITVACTERPRWQVTRWVQWTAFYDAYPGRTVLRERAGALCGPDAVPSVPTATDWANGLPITWCYRLYP